jgi:Rrf2 family protein
MMITTKGRNALKVMLDLAQRDDDNFVSLSDISERVKESQKYLEATVAALSSAGLIISARGKSGGYRLAKSPEDYSVAEIIAAAEGSLAPVSCLDSLTPCENADNCLSLPLWRELDDVITNFLRSKTLADLLPKSGK